MKIERIFDVTINIISILCRFRWNILYRVDDRRGIVTSGEKSGRGEGRGQVRRSKPSRLMVNGMEEGNGPRWRWVGRGGRGTLVRISPRTRSKFFRRVRSFFFSSWRRFLLLGKLEKDRIMEVWTIFLAVLQQFQMPRPNRGFVTIYLPRDETPLYRRFRKLFKSGSPSRRHHQGEAIVCQPAVDRLHQIGACLVEEKAIRAQDHVVQFFR